MRSIFGWIALCGALAQQQREAPPDDASQPYLLGYRSLDGIAGPMSRHAPGGGGAAPGVERAAAAPPDPEERIAWRRILREAEAAAEGGRLYVAIEKFQQIFGDSYLYSRMSLRNRYACLLYTSPSPRDQRGSRMPSSA